MEGGKSDGRLTSHLKGRINGVGVRLGRLDGGERGGGKRGDVMNENHAQLNF